MRKLIIVLLFLTGCGHAQMVSTQLYPPNLKVGTIRMEQGPWLASRQKDAWGKMNEYCGKYTPVIFSQFSFLDPPREAIYIPTENGSIPIPQSQLNFNYWLFFCVTKEDALTLIQHNPQWKLENQVKEN